MLAHAAPIASPILDSSHGHGTRMLMSYALLMRTRVCMSESESACACIRRAGREPNAHASRPYAPGPAATGTAAGYARVVHVAMAVGAWRGWQKAHRKGRSTLGAIKDHEGAHVNAARVHLVVLSFVSFTITVMARHRLHTYACEQLNVLVPTQSQCRL